MVPGPALGTGDSATLETNSCPGEAHSAVGKPDYRGSYGRLRSFRGAGQPCNEHFRNTGQALDLLGINSAEMTFLLF